MLNYDIATLKLIYHIIAVDVLKLDYLIKYLTLAYNNMWLSVACSLIL